MSWAKKFAKMETKGRNRNMYKWFIYFQMYIYICTCIYINVYTSIYLHKFYFRFSYKFDKTRYEHNIWCKIAWQTVTVANNYILKQIPHILTTHVFINLDLNVSLYGLTPVHELVMMVQLWLVKLLSTYSGFLHFLDPVMVILYQKVWFYTVPLGKYYRDLHFFRATWRYTLNTQNINIIKMFKTWATSSMTNVLHDMRCYSVSLEMS